MIQLFTLDRVQSSPAQVDLKKLQWMNGEYIRALPADRFETECRAVLQAAGLWRDDLPTAIFIASWNCSSRASNCSGCRAAGVYFLSEDFPFDEKAVPSAAKAGRGGGLRAVRAVFAAWRPSRPGD
jgi:hypothetical protein